jgi:hypothetical protein
MITLGEPAKTREVNGSSRSRHPVWIHVQRLRTVGVPADFWSTLLPNTPHSLLLEEIREVSGSHSGVDEESNLLGCDTLSLGDYSPMFRKIIVLPSSWSSWTVWPWRWKQYNPSKRRVSITQWHGVSFHKAWILRKTAALWIPKRRELEMC